MPKTEYILPSGPFRPKIPPALLTAGSLSWKAVAWWSNIDFLLSIRNQTFLVMFNLFFTYGSWVVVTIGVIWLLLVWQTPEKAKVGPGMLIVVGTLAFIWGVLITVHAGGSVPRVIVSWGNVGSACLATVDTSRLSGFRNKYYIGMVCGITDPSVDKLEDRRITISSPFNILPVAVSILAPYSKAMAEAMNAFNAAGIQQVNVWYEAILIPKDTDMTSIRRLSDVIKYQGKILSEGYFE